MREQQGSTLFELLAVVAITGILAAIVVPGAGTVRRALSGPAGARELALVLRAAQARAQARATTVQVAVAGDGSYTVRDLQTGTPGRRSRRSRSPAASLAPMWEATTPMASSSSGARDGPVCPAPQALAPGPSSVGGDHRVVVQLAGCVRCA